MSLVLDWLEVFDIEPNRAAYGVGQHQQCGHTKHRQVADGPANKGALTRKPLPMIDASGVTVACQPEDLDKVLRKKDIRPAKRP